MARRRLPDEPVDIVLPIPSFLDMAFQILAFFVATYHPSSLEVQMEMALPASADPRAQTQQQADPTTTPDSDADLKSEITVTIKTAHEGRPTGKITGITVEGADGVETPVPGDFDSDRELAGVTSFLTKMQKGLSNKDSIKIKAESGLKYGFVVKVIDACKKAKFTNVGFAAPPDYTAGN
jgi:biopolymer transport protein ExbD